MISSTLLLRKHKPWYNATLRHEKRKLHRLERKRVRITDSKLRVAVQQYSTLLRTTRNSYYDNVLRDADCKAVHNITAELMGEHTAMPRPECSDDAELATKFSSYFKDKISDIHKSLPPPRTSYTSLLYTTRQTWHISLLQKLSVILSSHQRSKRVHWTRFQGL